MALLPPTTTVNLRIRRPDDSPRHTKRTSPHGLSDLCRAMNDSHYIIDPTAWHNPTESGRCRVYVAGSVMALTLGVDKNLDRTPFDFDPPLDGQLLALDALADGRLTRGINSLGTVVADEDLRRLYDDLERQDWHDDLSFSATSGKYHRAVERLADLLEQHGI